MLNSSLNDPESPGGKLFEFHTRALWEGQNDPMPTSHLTPNNHLSASNKMPRQINRNLIFNEIRTRQPISRADLARCSGLQRSTVSLIVEELLAQRWIVEGSMGRLP